MAKLKLQNGKAIKEKTGLEVAKDNFESAKNKGSTIAELRQRINAFEQLVLKLLEKVE